MCQLRCNHGVSRRGFIQSSAAAALSGMFWGIGSGKAAVDSGDIKQCGPASKYIPKLRVAFVRRTEEYGMWWPGQIYDGEAARKKYTQQIANHAKKLGMYADIRSLPIYSLEEGEAWIAESEAKKADGILVVTLDRQQHTWPTVNKAIDSPIPTVVFSPIGSSFTTNTAAPSKKKGVVIYSTDDFSQVEYGMKMIYAGAKLRETRFLVIKGKERVDTQLANLGTKLRYVPADDFIKEYDRIPNDAALKKMADELITYSTKITGATKQDVLNGIKSYFVAKNLLEREECDAISMDCLGALAKSKKSLPCIAWSHMNDHAIPAACEADLGACAMHAIVQYLFDRPGFQQDPVAETSMGALIGAHCSCPTKLNGFAKPGEAYDIVNHHGARDATARPVWKIDQDVTVVDLVPDAKNSFAGIVTVDDAKDGDELNMLISAGKVVENVSAPPAGGCVVSVAVKLKGVEEYLDYPGFHQLFFYGDYRKQLRDFCRLYGIKPVLV